MKKLIAGAALATALALPAGAVADGEQPSPTQTKNAAKFCKELRKSSGAENFKALFGGKKNAFGKCVSQTARQRDREDAKQEQEAKQNAAQQCRAERQADPQAFADKYGKNKNKKNAFGKCVSQKAHENKQQADAEDKAEDEAKVNAARSCKAERKADPQAFAEKYGKRRNAFGKCVSRTAREADEAQQG